MVLVHGRSGLFAAKYVTKGNLIEHVFVLVGHVTDQLCSTRNATTNHATVRAVLFVYFRNKTFSPCFQSLVKTEANVWENSRADRWKPETQSSVFSCSRIHSNLGEVFTCLWYTEKMFYFFYKDNSFRFNKEKEDIGSAYSFISFDL